MGAFLADPKAEDQVQRTYEIEVTNLVREALVGLDERERVRQLEYKAKNTLRAKLNSLRASLGRRSVGQEFSPGSSPKQRGFLRT